MGAKKDRVGQRFGRLTVIERVGRTSNYTGIWRCKCDCGNYVNLPSYSLTGGNSQSCGCLQKELARQQFTVHGGKGTPEYAAYRRAKHRCTNPNNIGYEYYGGRGIEFRFTSFQDFVKELGPRPEGTTLDRINNNGHYELGNVRWATASQQTLNRRKRGTKCR